MPTTWDDLPPSFDPRNPLTNPSGNGAWSAEYDLDGAGNRQSLSWLGPFTEFEAFRNAALYRPETIALGTGTITRNVPLVCPYDSLLHALRVHFRSLTSLTPEEADELGLDIDAADAPPYGRVIATVDFGVLPYGTGGSTPFVSIRKQSTPKRATIPNFAYTLVDDSNAVVEALAQDVAVPVPEETFEITWHGLQTLAPFEAVVGPLVDRVNASSVTLPQVARACPAGTLYVAGTSGQQQIDTGNVAKAEASVTLIRRELPWNRAIGSSGTPRWVAPSGTPTGRVFTTADISPVWRGY